jgi:HK97 family phage major capsid protein
MSDEIVNEIKERLDGYKASIEEVKNEVNGSDAKFQKALAEVNQRISSLSAPAPTASGKEYVNEWREYLKGGPRFVRNAVTTGTSGGIAPTWYSNEVIEKITNQTKLYQLVRKIQIPAVTGSFPISSGAALPTFADESTATGTDGTLAYPARTITIDGLKTSVSVSERLVQLSNFNIDELVQQDIINAYSLALDKMLLVGTSNIKGILFADAEAVPTSQDISTAGAAINADLLYGFTTNFKARTFNPNTTVLLMHPTVWNTIRMAKASTSGVYLIGEGVGAGTFDGLPIVLSRDATATSSTGDYIATIADLSKYVVGLGSDLMMDVVPDFANGKFIYYPRLYIGGKPMDTSAFYRLKVTTS